MRRRAPTRRAVQAAAEREQHQPIDVTADHPMKESHHHQQPPPNDEKMLQPSSVAGSASPKDDSASPAPAAAAAASVDRPPLPAVQALVNQSPAGLTLDRVGKKHATQAKRAQAGKKQSQTVAQCDANHWLLLCSAGGIEEVTVGSGTRLVKSDGLVAATRILLHHLHAQPAVKDTEGYTAVHWLMFSSILECGHEQLQFKPKEDAQLAAFDNGGAVPGAEELAAPWLWKLSRYRIEPALELLLAQSAECGYCGDACVHWWQEELQGRPSLLDIQDKRGNTALHHAVAHRRVDLVSLLLCHGASATIVNRAGQTAFDLVQWQKVSGVALTIGETKHSMFSKNEDQQDEEMKGSSESDLDEVIAVPEFNGHGGGGASNNNGGAGLPVLHSLLADLDSSIYTSLTHKIERRWGTREGLRIDRCSYEGETDEAAIKRLLFQRLLYNAVDAGEDGDIDEVTKLVVMWQEAYSPAAGHRMWPLTYRADSDFGHPLQVAVSYASDSTAVLRLLLQLPLSLHVQPRRFQYASLPLALVNNNLEAADLLLAAGFNVNMRDAANGKTTLHAIAEMRTMEEPAALVTDGESAYSTSTNLCRLTREMIQRGADPTIVDELGNTPLIVAASRGEVGLVSLYLQWNAMQEALAHPPSASLQTAATSDFVRHVNVYGNSAMHYAMYRAHVSHRHVDSLQLLHSAGCWPSETKNRAGLTPLQLFAAPETKCGKRACKEVLKMSLEQVVNANPPRKRIKRKVVVADLSSGLESFAVEAISEYEVSKDEVAALKDFVYVTSNHWTTPTNPTEAAIPKLDHKATTISEALDTQTGAVSYNFTPKRGGDDGDDAEADDEEELIVQGQHNPAETRRLLSKGLATPVQVRMTPKCGWGLFTVQFIPRGTFVCEYVGDLLTTFDGERRTLLYISRGLHSVYQFNGLSSLDGDQFSVDPLRRGSASRFINHSCDANLEVRRVLDHTRLALYAVCDIEPGQELTFDYKYEPTEVGLALDGGEGKVEPGS